ncbi:MAG: hypothetical protein KDI87_00335 [Gammaproteobacteria bacterium]|nr:hypothetical protein [Gammaproteobacteria bacterium]
MRTEPNIYVCSTVRHLLFSLLRAASCRDESHYILFFADYQQASLGDWHLDKLPANMTVCELSRGRVRQQLAGSLRGRLCYFLAMRGLRAPAIILGPLHSILAEASPELSRALADTGMPHLWLFNERNRMARLLRLLARRFSVLEDGEGNYLLQRCPWWKWPARLVRGLPARHRVFGEEDRCESVWVLHPERLPAPVRHKGRQIDFLTSSAGLATIRQLFDAETVSAGEAQQVILASQPFGIPGVTTADKQQVYGQIIDYLQTRGMPVVLKIHPAEDAGDYGFLGEKVRRAPAKIPLEALLLGASRPPIVLSVLSTAGLGFERYCRRIKLCEDGASDSLYFQTVQRWVADPETLDAVLRKKLPG